jgi:hypothetical protein
MIELFLEGIGLCGPGLPGWEASAAILTGAQPYEPAPSVIPPAALLPPNERRRAVQTVRIALAVGADAFAAAGLDPAATATIFASSGGDGDTIDQILTVLASETREVSPTKFHNSVHNAPAGYWSIATGAQTPSTSLCAHDDSFAAGLLEAGAQAVTAQAAIALIVYDTSYPGPLNLVRPIGAPFAVALVLSPNPTPASFARLAITLTPATTPTEAPPALEALRQTTPAARSLPLLAALAGQTPATIRLAYLDDLALALALTPAR